MKDKLEKVTDITQLKPGDKIISIGVTSEILEFLCIHPHNNNYSLFLNSNLDGTIVKQKQNENTLPLSIGHEDLNFSQTTSV